VLSRRPRRRSTTTRTTKRRRRRARGRLSSVSTAPTCLSTARTSRGRSGHRSQLKDSEYIPLLRKMPESRELLTTWRPRVKKPKSSPGGGASNRRLYRRAAAEDAGVSQRAFDDVEAARQEAEVVSRVGGASNRRLYRRAAAEDAGVSQRAFYDVEAARQEAEVVSELEAHRTGDCTGEHRTGDCTGAHRRRTTTCDVWQLRRSWSCRSSIMICFRMSKSTRRQVPALGPSSASSGDSKLYADGSLKWLSWAEANQQAALDRYAEIRPELNIPES